MKIEDVIRLLRDGIKLRKKFWGSEQYIHLVDGVVVDDRGSAFTGQFLDMSENTGWEVFEEKIEHGIYVDEDEDVYLYDGRWQEWDKIDDMWYYASGVDIKYMKKYNFKLFDSGAFDKTYKPVFGLLRIERAEEKGAD